MRETKNHKRTLHDYTAELMKIRAAFLFLLTGITMGSAWAQWQWIDETGRKAFSDRPPPSHIPEKNILHSPAGAAIVNTHVLPKVVPSETAAAESAEAAEAEKPAAPSAEALKLAKEAAAQKAADEKKQKEERARFLQQRSENCNRAQAALRTLQSDVELSQIGADGQRVAMSKLQREQDIRRTREVVARDCGPAPKE